MSTKVFNLVIDAYIFIWWVLLCNPVSMALIHWVKPKLASSLAHNKLFCGKEMCAFYTKLARKWPFKWSKWWLTLEDLQALDDQKQVVYFLKVNHAQDTLDTLSARALLILVDDYRDDVKKIIKNMRLPNKMFAEILISPLAEELPPYVKRIGTLPKEQQQILMRQAVSDSYLAINTNATDMFLSYIERCGLSKDLAEQFKHDSAGAGFKHCAMRAIRCYEQRMVVRKYHDLDTEEAKAEWANYLKKEGKLYTNPSMEMSVEQYQIFHKLGLTLKEDAILRFFKQADSSGMKYEILQLEPRHGIANDEIWETVCNNPYLKKMFYDVLTPEEKNRNVIIKALVEKAHAD